MTDPQLPKELSDLFAAAPEMYAALREQFVVAQTAQAWVHVGVATALLIAVPLSIKAARWALSKKCEVADVYEVAAVGAGIAAVVALGFAIGNVWEATSHFIAASTPDLHMVREIVG